MPFTVKPGSLVGVKFFGPFTHVGIAGDRFINGEQTVLNASSRRGYAAEEPMSDFLQGGELVCLNHGSKVHPIRVISSARSTLGRKWAIWENCEHFAYEALGIGKTSPQLNLVLGLAGFAAGMSLLVKLAKR